MSTFWSLCFTLGFYYTIESGRHFSASFRDQKIRDHLVIYLDDFLIVGTTTQECSDAVAQVIHVLESLGFLFNFNKSETVLTQCVEYIGLITNSVSMSFCLTDKKICDIHRLCTEVLKRGKCYGKPLLLSRPDMRLSSDACLSG
jgi:hypothetical protein